MEPLYMSSGEQLAAKIKAVPVDALEKGMKCAYDIKTATGDIILSAGSPIEARHIDLLHFMGLDTIDVVDEGVTPMDSSCGALPRWQQDALKKKSAIIVDDNEVPRIVLRKFLSNLGIKVVGEATNGAQALKIADRLQPDIITMDILMPGMDGVTTLKMLRESGIKAVVIIVTSQGMEEQVIECISAGAADFIRKPFQQERVTSSVVNSLFKR